MRKFTMIVGAAIALAAAAALGSGVSAAMSSSATGGTATTAQDTEGPDNNSDVPLTGTDLDKATAAALAHTGGGTVTETEVGDGRAAYSVEIRKSDGRQVEVNLDRNFNVIGEESDDD